MGKGIGAAAALTGLAFFAVAIVAFTIGGDPPDPTDDSVQEIVDFYVDNETSQVVSAYLAGIGGTLLVFFGGALRRVLRDAEGPEGFLSAIAFAGLIIIATGLAIDATIIFTLVETAEDLEPGAVQGLSALYNNDYVPFAVGTQIFLLATGISVVIHGALPKWIGFLAIPLALIAVTPIGFVSFIAAGVLIAIISVLLAMRGRRTATSTEGRAP